MSTLDEKLELPTPTTIGLARQKLKQLRTRWGAEVDNWTEAPTLVMVNIMEDREIWRLVRAHPHQQCKTIGDNIYELIETTKRAL